MSQKAKAEERTRKIHKVEQKAKTTGVQFLETISPIQKKPPTISRRINLVVIILGFISLSLIYKELGMIKFMFTDSLAEWDFSMFVYFLPIMILPLATILLWLRKRIGWILISGFSIFNIVNLLPMLFYTFSWENDNSLSDLSSSDLKIEIHEYEQFIFTPNPMIYLATIVFWGGILWVLHRNDIRNVYQISIKDALNIAIVAGLITGLINFGLM